jgi:hypothetical protein
MEQLLSRRSVTNVRMEGEKISARKEYLAIGNAKGSEMAFQATFIHR